MIKMIIRKNPLLTVALLAGCASPSQQTDLYKLHNQVSQLNSQMQQLTRQATVLAEQNTLNTHSTQGAWLLPDANTPVQLKSSVGEIQLSLSPLISRGSGSQTMLNIKSVALEDIPAFTAQVEWGERDPATGKPLQASQQSQTVRVANALQPQSDITIPLSLSHTSPAQAGYFRIHSLVAISPSQR